MSSYGFEIQHVLPENGRWLLGDNHSEVFSSSGYIQQVSSMSTGLIILVLLKPSYRQSRLNVNVYLREIKPQMHISPGKDIRSDPGGQRMIEHQRGGRYQHLSLRCTAGR